MLNGDSARFVGEQADLWEEAQSCGVCEADTWEPASEVCGRRIGRCAKCGTHRLVDRGAEGQLHLLYGHYYTSADPDAAKLKTQLRNPTFAHRRRRLEAAVGSRQRRFFEIGCGDGNYLASCRRAGWDVAGSEFSEETVALIRRRHDISATMANVPIEAPPGARYPVVGAFHVLEHLYHPVEWLHAVGRMLEPAGLLHLQVPNHGSLIRLLTGSAWSAHAFPQHVYFYTPATLEVLLERTGFHTSSETVVVVARTATSSVVVAAEQARRWCMGSPCECRSRTSAIIRVGRAAPAPGAGHHSPDGYQSHRDGRSTITARPLHLHSCHPRMAADEQDRTPARCRLWPRPPADGAGGGRLFGPHRVRWARTSRFMSPLCVSAGKIAKGHPLRRIIHGNCHDCL